MGYKIDNNNSTLISAAGALVVITVHLRSFFEKVETSQFQDSQKAHRVEERIVLIQNDTWWSRKSLNIKQRICVVGAQV